MCTDGWEALPWAGTRSDTLWLAAILQSDLTPTAQCDFFAKEFGKVNHSLLLLDTLSSLSPGSQAPGSSPIPLADSFQSLALASLLLSHPLNITVQDSVDSHQRNDSQIINQPRPLH